MRLSTFRLTAPLALGLAISGVAALGCSQTAAKAADTKGSATPAAKIGGRSISNTELDAKLADDMKALKEREKAAEEQLKAQLDDMRRQVQEQEYNLRKKALLDMVTEMEAQSRSMTAAALVSQEVTSKVAVTPADSDALWEEVKARVRGTREQVQPQLQAMVVQRKTEAAMAVFHRGLMKKYQVQFLGLQPARATIDYAKDAPAIGPADAPITIVEYTDYQCPFCQQAEMNVQKVLARFGDKVRLVYRDFPLDFHSQAKPAGIAARCAGEQGKFWEMHRNLLLKPGTFDEADFKKRAASLSLDTGAFETCVASGKFETAVQAGLDEGKKNGVSGTPTFFLNGRSFSGAQPFEHFEKLIEEELFLKGMN